MLTRKIYFDKEGKFVESGKLRAFCVVSLDQF